MCTVPMEFFFVINLLTHADFPHQTRSTMSSMALTRSGSIKKIRNKGQYALSPEATLEENPNGGAMSNAYLEEVDENTAPKMPKLHLRK